MQEKCLQHLGLRPADLRQLSDVAFDCLCQGDRPRSFEFRQSTGLAQFLFPALHPVPGCGLSVECLRKLVPHSILAYDDPCLVCDSASGALALTDKAHCPASFGVVPNRRAFNV
jgi:hypothetical protein